ncbi:ABC transporter permease [Labrys neptuniae]
MELLGFGPTGWGVPLLQGALLTIGLALCTLPFGLLLGLGVAMAKHGGPGWLGFLCGIYTSLFRALPELLTILIVYFLGQSAVNTILTALGIGIQIEISGFVAGFVALGLVLGAFSSEVWLGALRSLSRGQSEGAAALGLSRGQTFRKIILPQLIRTALPGLGNNWMALLKDTSLVSAIAVSELMYMTNRAVFATKQPLMFYAACCLLYLVMAILSGIAQSWLERHYSRGQTLARA